MKLLNYTKTNTNFDNSKAKDLYNGLLSVDSSILNITEHNMKQILKDLNRTYPDNKLFNLKQQQKMLNVLRAYSNYDSEISK